MLEWYKGIEADRAAIKEGKRVVLHADRDLCRVMIMSGDGKLVRIRGFPSKERVRAAAADPDFFFSFDGKQYVQIPCMEYSAIPSDSTDATLKEMYRKYCECPEDESFSQFINTWRKSAQSPKPTLSVYKNYARCTFVVTLENKAIGNITFDLQTKVADVTGVCRVVGCDKQRIVDDIHRLIANYGNSPAREDLLVYANNILREFARQLREQGIEFDPTLFDAQ